MKDDIRKVEQSVLETFQEEIPSVYYSDKTEKEFEQFKANATYMYRHLFKFPPKMFSDYDLIDFGAGTGENTVYLANWGARCTLVEMNEKAQDISKELFRKYTDNYEAHRFVRASIFDYESPTKYDIVRCGGVLSHTADKEGAFAKISSFLKPGGFLIYGDPNKAGGFQNMLQRYIVYKFGKTWDEMVKVSEMLFKEDIDRSQRFVNRKRRTIIFDRWVVEKQDDPSVKEVLQWFEQNDLELYSSHPPVLFPYLSDSAHHTPKFDLNSFKDIAVLTEAAWLSHNEDDNTVIPEILGSFKALSNRQASLTDYVANCDKNTFIDSSILREKIDAYIACVENVDVTSYLAGRLKDLLEEVKNLFVLLEKNDIEAVRSFIKQTKHLFRGAIGVRNVDFVAYKKG